MSSCQPVSVVHSLTRENCHTSQKVDTSCKLPAPVMSPMHQRKGKHQEVPDAPSSGPLVGTADNAKGLSSPWPSKQAEEEGTAQTSSISREGAGNAYHGAAVSNNARAHFGDVITGTVINNYGPPNKSEPHANTKRVAAFMKA